MKKLEIAFRKFIVEKKIDNMNLALIQKEEYINKLLDAMNEPEKPVYEITLEQLKVALNKSLNETND